MTSLKLQDYTWMNGSSHQFWLLPAELQELEQTWRTSNFPGLSGTVGKPVSDEVRSQGCRVEISLHRTSGNLRKTSRFTPFSIGVWRQSKQSYVQVKGYCKTALKSPHSITVKTSKVNMRKADSDSLPSPKIQLGRSAPLCLATMAHYFSKNSTTANSVMVESWWNAHTVWWIGQF